MVFIVYVSHSNLRAVTSNLKAETFLYAKTYSSVPSIPLTSFIVEKDCWANTFDI